MGKRNPSLTITFCHHSASLVMPNDEPWDEITYPYLTLTIFPYILDRAEPFISGEYDQNICFPGNSSCAPCQERLPSCIGNPDGAHAFTGLEWTDNYITCYKNRTVGIDKCPTSSYFDPRNNGCVSKLNVGECRRLNMVIYVTLDEIIDDIR